MLKVNLEKEAHLQLQFNSIQQKSPILLVVRVCVVSRQFGGSKCVEAYLIGRWEMNEDNLTD